MQPIVHLPESRHRLGCVAVEASKNAEGQSDLPDAQELRDRLKQWCAGSISVTEIAEMFMALYEPFRNLKPLGTRKEAWKAYLAAERLRVEDLEPQPGAKQVRRLAGALVAAQMDQLAASLVLGVSQMSVSRYVQASERSAPPSSSCVPLPPRSGKTESRRETAERVVTDLVRKASEAPLVPTDALTLVVTSSAHVKEYVGEFVSGLSDGAQLTEQGEALLLQAVRELEALAGTLRRTGGQRCVSV